MKTPELIVPGLRESPLVESLQLGNDVASLARAQELMERLARDSLSTVVDQAMGRIDAIDMQRGRPLYEGDDEVLRRDADPLLGDLALASKIKRTHFRYLLAEGEGYVIHGNLYGMPVHAGNDHTYEGPGKGSQVENEHTHNRHFVAMRAWGASYLAHERRTLKPTDTIIDVADDDTWMQHRLALTPRDVIYEAGMVYGMDADSIHALELGGISLSVLIELLPVREFSTSFNNADGTVRAYHENDRRKFNSLLAKIQGAIDREHASI